MRAGVFVLGLLVMFAGLLAVTPTFRTIPLIVAAIGVAVAAVGAALPRKASTAQPASS